MTAPTEENDDTKPPPKRLEPVSSAPLKSQGNIYTFKALANDQFAVGLLQRKILAMNIKQAGGGKKNGTFLRSQEMLPLSNYLKSNCEIISMEVFYMDNSIFVGATFVETPVEADADEPRRFCLQLWRATDLISLQQDRFVSTTSIELPFVPYHLLHLGQGKLWLAGSDCKLHQFSVRSGLNLAVIEDTDHPMSGETFSSPVIKIGLKAHLGALWTAVACEDGRLSVYRIVNDEANRVLIRNFEGLSDVKFTAVDQQVNLVAVVSMDVSRMLVDLSAESPKIVTLDKSNDYDVALTTCCCYGDDNQAFILLGTYGQEILIYNAEGHLLGQHSVNHPVLAMLPTHKNSVAVMTNKSVEILEIK